MTPDIYRLLAKLAVIGAILFAVFVGGCSVQRKHDAAVRDNLKAVITSQELALGAAASALRDVSDKTKAAVAEARQIAAIADQAGAIALAQHKRADKAERELSVAIAAGRKKPGCDALLNGDLEAVCGLPRR